MIAHKHIDKICCIVICLTVLFTAVFMNVEIPEGEITDNKILGYENLIFDTSRVHTVNIITDKWNSFIKNCTDENYTVCNVEIDGETVENVAIRAKGNTSLSQVAQYGNDRYSFKIEFDQYDDAKSYHGLDKLCLNNIIQDNTYMKDYLVYRMMNESGVAAPLCSYAYVTVNGEDFGLYLAVEAVEDSFLQRNYGASDGDLYKPDSMNMGGGRGNGRDFSMSDSENVGNAETVFGDVTSRKPFGEIPPGEMPSGEMFPEMTPPDAGQKPSDNDGSIGKPQTDMGGRTPGFTGNDVSLIYTDDNYSSYSNIFNNAKTNVTNEDKTRLISSIKKINEKTELESAVDIEQVIRYFVVHNFVLNFDSYTGSMIHNYYLYEQDGRMAMIPWDYNLAFSGFMSSTDATALANYPIDSPVSGGTIESRPMLAWIFSDEEYTELYHKYFNEFIEEYYNKGRLEVMITSVKNMISPYVEKDPSKFCSYEEFRNGADTLRDFCLLRCESIKAQLEGRIGKTSETQDKANLVDAGNINISSMGSMGNMGGKGNRPDSFQNRGDSTQITEENVQTNSQNSLPDFSNAGVLPEKGQQKRTDITQGSFSFVPAALSALVLTAGFALVFSYGRRGKRE
ncbi:MAG: CotH kinase family protein [Clostridia bacterium]|nr:CotH kinase family protein [Clostridia bacterium]